MAHIIAQATLKGLAKLAAYDLSKTGTSMLAHAIGKLQRHMVFVSMDDVNLFDYLQSRRRHEEPCKKCFYSIACEGFYYWLDEWKDEAAARFGD